MKLKTFKSAFVLLAVLTFSACDKSDSDPKNKDNEDLKKVWQVRDAAAFIQGFIFNDLGAISGDAGGRTTINAKVLQSVKMLTTCAEPVTEEDETGAEVITMDFGDGCESDDVVLKGNIKITTHFVDGSVLFSVDYFNYQETYDGNTSAMVTGTCEGTFIITDSFMLLLTELKLDLSMMLPDGNFVTFSSSQKIENTEDEIRFTELTTDGVFYNGDSFHSSVIQPLVYKLSCESEYPVKGIEAIGFNDQNMQVNYGNGECDDDYAVLNP